MKKSSDDKSGSSDKSRSGFLSRGRSIALTIIAFLFVFFVIFPLAFSIFDTSKSGNVALIPISGPVTVEGDSYLGSSTASSTEIVGFIKEAEKNPRVKVIMLEINSPGGSAVASDEIASAVRKAEKPVIALIRETGASGGYWIASSADHIIANRMSITGSIGVLSSYLEFSGLMEKYGVNYEQLTAGKYKEIGSPFKELSSDERKILQDKLDKIHQFFIEEIAANRKLPQSKVKAIASGEFFLGAEAYDLGLIDELGDKDTAEEYIKLNYGLKTVDYAVYERKTSLLDLFKVMSSNIFFNIGEGLGAVFIKSGNNLVMV
ncbi:MAG: signal peptide peptidase SppA [Nanoarchaeota archaeon]